MANIRQRNDPVRLFWRRLFMAGLSVFVLFGIWAVVGVYAKDRESSQLRIEAESQLQDLQKRETALNTRISTLETNRGQEAALRNAYQVGKEGEGVVMIVDKPATDTPTDTTESRGWLRSIFWWW